MIDECKPNKGSFGFEAEWKKSKKLAELSFLKYLDFKNISLENNNEKQLIKKLINKKFKKKVFTSTCDKIKLGSLYLQAKKENDEKLVDQHFLNTHFSNILKLKNLVNAKKNITQLTKNQEKQKNENI